MKFLLTLGLSVVMAFQNVAQDALPRLSVKGNKVVDESGKVFTFQGLNISDPDKLAKQGNWNRRYFEEIEKWGANLVRIPIHPPRLRERGHEEYIALLDQGIQWATELGLYVVLDWHSIGNLKSEMFFLPIYETSKKETFDFWRMMTAKYKDNTTVAFFELFNEPTLFNGRLGTCTWDEWKAIMEELIIIIRASGGKAIPLVAGFNWAYDLSPVKYSPLNAEGIAYVSHPYPQKKPKPWIEDWDKDFGFVADRYPLFLTEIGFCSADARGAHVPVISDESYGDAITKYTSEKGISYVGWVFDAEWSPMMFTDWEKFTPTMQGKYFKKAMQEKRKQEK